MNTEGFPHTFGKEVPEKNKKPIQNERKTYKSNLEISTQPPTQNDLCRGPGHLLE